MPRPKNKEELLSLSQKNYEKLNVLIDSFDAEQQVKDFPKGTLNRNIRDVLMHLHHWHLMLLDWYTVGMQGDKPDMPAKGYTWKTTPDLNTRIQKQYVTISFNEARAKLRQSFGLVRSTIESHTNDELFEKKRYKWTGSTSIGSYFISATSSHYDWAFKLIKRATK